MANALIADRKQDHQKNMPPIEIIRCGLAIEIYDIDETDQYRYHW